METEYFTKINIFCLGKTNTKTKIAVFSLGQNSKENAEIKAKEAFFNYAKHYFKYSVLKDEIIEKINSKQLTTNEALKDQNNIDLNIISKINDPLNKWGDKVFALGNITFNDNNFKIFYEVEYEDILH